jgi:hypothetical protein
MVNSPFEQIDAFGVSVLSDVEDFVNARIRFANGCIASLTASRTYDDDGKVAGLTIKPVIDYRQTLESLLLN